MAEPPARQDPQQIAAERLVELLEAAMVPLAASQPRRPTDTSTPEQVDLFFALRELARTLQEFVERGVTQRPEPDTWAWLADVLASATWLCRQQAVIDVDDAEPDGDHGH